MFFTGDNEGNKTEKVFRGSQNPQGPQFIFGQRRVLRVCLYRRQIVRPHAGRNGNWRSGERNFVNYFVGFAFSSRKMFRLVM